MANITGGGLKNLSRMNKDYKYVIEGSLEPQPIFEFLQDEENVSDKEMYRTFNMGMGFCIITSSDDAEEIIEDTDGQVIGEVEEGKGVILEEKDLKF